MTDLVAALDAAATKLLEQAGLGPTTPAKIEATPAERVKAFDSVMEYAKLRPTLAPAKKEDSAFDRIKREFNDPAPERRGRPRKAKAEGNPDGAEPGAIVVNGGSVSSDDLFDA